MDKIYSAEIAKILGVSEDSIYAMDKEIKDGMQSVFDTITVNNDEDKKMLYDALDNLWQKGTVLIVLKDVAQTTGIPYNTLTSLDYDTQQTLVFEFMADNSQTERFYEVTNKALAVMELDKVSRLLSVPVRELRKLPIEVQEKLCGYYAMEYDKDSTNAELITVMREMITI
jgi:hypothetical protein